MDLIQKSVDSKNSTSNGSADNFVVNEAICNNSSSTEGKATQKKIIQGVLDNYTTKVDNSSLRQDHINQQRLRTEIGQSPTSTNKLQKSSNNTTRTTGFYKQWSPAQSPPPINSNNPSASKQQNDELSRYVAREHLEAPIFRAQRETLLNVLNIKDNTPDPRSSRSMERDVLNNFSNQTFMNIRS